MKTCNKCNKKKPLFDFYKHKETADGHLGFCRECVKTRIKKHRNEHLEEVRAYDRFRRRRENMSEEKIKKLNEQSYERNYFGWNRAKAMKRDKYTCQKCGSKTNRLCVHHKDGNNRYSALVNNSLSNLQTLCIPCHTGNHAKERIKNGYVPPINPRGENGQYRTPF